jgi:hypothetical protein
LIQIITLTHPGRILQEEFMEPVGLSLYAKTERSVVCNFENTDAVNANDAGLKALQACVGSGH